MYHFEAITWLHPVHNHTYFEIIFILQGSGEHNINGNTFRYGKGDIFLLGPEDFHSFNIEERTEFCFIRFNESYSKAIGVSEDTAWNSAIETVLSTSSQSRGSLVRNPQDSAKLHKLLTVLQAEYDQHRTPYYELMRNGLMRSILLLLARNLRSSHSEIPLSNHNDSVEAILRYIKKHIYSPSKLTIANLANEFHLAPGYISNFFKKHVGESIKQYITRYKMKLIEVRLTYSQNSVSEIAYEFGFTDESHFCKQFRKLYGITPTQFKKRN
jgi:AraC-like DNA-binding protein